MCGGPPALRERVDASVRIEVLVVEDEPLVREVVVADLRLGPGVDGLALAAEARRRWPGVGVVYATGRPDHLDGRLLGPRERYLVKPFAPGALLGAVRDLMLTRVLGLALQ